MSRLRISLLLSLGLVLAACSNTEPPAKDTQPGVTDPAPTDPEPTDPEPTDPAPTDPEPTDPEPTDPAPTDPEPTDPEPTDSTKAAPTVIGIGESMSGVIAGEARDFDYFKFTAAAGDRLRLRAVAPDGSTLDPYMRLYGPSGYLLLAKSDDTLTSENAEILFNADMAGEYLVEITSFKLINAPEASDNLPSNTYTFSLSRR